MEKGPQSECSLDIGQVITEAHHHLVQVLTGFPAPCYSFSLWGNWAQATPAQEKKDLPEERGSVVTVGKSYAKVPGDLGLA